MYKRIYVSGAVTETSDYSERFSQGALEASKLAFAVIDPSKLDFVMPNGCSHEEWMSICYPLLELCDAIYMLDGWETSTGANLELLRANQLGIKVLYQSELQCNHSGTYVELANTTKSDDLLLEFYSRFKVGQTVQHFKREIVGDKYVKNEFVYSIVGLAEDTESGKTNVIYSQLYHRKDAGYGKLWSRTLESFLSEVNHSKYKGIKQKYKFEPLKED